MLPPLTRQINLIAKTVTLRPEFISRHSSTSVL
jgi:hypothetical protein